MLAQFHLCCVVKSFDLSFSYVSQIIGSHTFVGCFALVVFIFICISVDELTEDQELDVLLNKESLSENSDHLSGVGTLDLVVDVFVTDAQVFTD